jgi:acyl carrier protein
MIELDAVVKAIAEAGVVPDMSKFDPSKNFKENGVDSLDVMTILLAVEEMLDIKINEEEASQISSAVRLVEVINNR